MIIQQMHTCLCWLVICA